MLFVYYFLIIYIWFTFYLYIIYILFIDYLYIIYILLIYYLYVIYVIYSLFIYYLHFIYIFIYYLHISMTPPTTSDVTPLATFKISTCGTLPTAKIKTLNVLPKRRGEYGHVGWNHCITTPFLYKCHTKIIK